MLIFDLLCHKENMGFASKMKMCSVCYDEKCEFFLCQELVSDQQNVAFEINPRWSCLA